MYIFGMCIIPSSAHILYRRYGYLPNGNKNGNVMSGTVREGIFNGYLEVFWIFLKNEHGKVKGTPNWEV